jgi:3-deoxy-D-manno-octulosonate 8-phosphate phosphatase (KDO 8-P phosphatase)
MNYFRDNLEALLKVKRIDEKELLTFCSNNSIFLNYIMNGKVVAGIDLLQYVSSQSNYSYKQLVDQKILFENESRMSEIRMLVMDVDGVLTDAGMFYTESGDEFKKFNAKDGMAIRNLSKNGFKLGIISSGFNKTIIERRAELLGIQHVYLGTDEKLEVLKSWCKKLNISLNEIAFIGDDINDVQLMKAVGFSACPADAIDRVKEIADLVLSKKGGKGCVREFVDDYLTQ